MIIPWILHILADMLAQRIDAVEGQDRPVQGIHPFFRIGCGMGRLAEKGEMDFGKPEVHLEDLPFRRRVDHHGKIHIIEKSGLDQFNLPIPSSSAGVPRTMILARSGGRE